MQKERVHTGHENDSLALQVHDLSASGSYILDFDFHCDVFNETQQQQAVQHFLQILDALLDEPNQSLHRVSLLSSEERERVLRKFNETQFALPKSLTVPRLFEEQVHRKPHQVAVRFEGQSLTYVELNSRANQLAHYLKSLGVGPETIVGICAEPSLAILVGIMGILKAGGAYLALDPEHPSERLAFMLNDARVALLLTEKRLVEQYPRFSAAIRNDSTDQVQTSSVRIVYVDADGPAIDSQGDENPDSNLTADNSAYIIYTSGSTGKAKGVIVPHGGLCNRLLWARKFYGLNETDRCLQKASFSYDASVWEIFEPLLAGAQIIMARPGGRRDSAYLAELIAKHSITVAEFVPSMLRLLLEEKAIEDCRSLKRVFSGGEVLPLELQKTFFEKLSSDLHNTYGPTEASIDVTHWKCEPGANQEPIPIGRPIGNTQIYILDAHLNPVPIGIAGELHIGGVGLARGYLNRPELTAEKFIPDPFSGEPGLRLYKTGDLARYLNDGNVEFLGRLDHQVKIRGFRIELAEIEAALREHPAVRETVVVVLGDAPGEQRLVAYAVTNQEPAPTTTELRSFLKEKLPDYMLPSACVFLKAFPLTASGKVDRQALPIPEKSRPELEKGVVAPRTPAESTIAEIWRDLLGVDRVGIYDNFFDLGGHSLLALRLFARFEKAFGKKPLLSSFFQRPTIEHLAKVITQRMPSTGSSCLVAIQPQGVKRPFFCVHEFFGDVVCYTNLARRMGQDQPFYALQARGLDGNDEPLADIGAMAAHYIDQIRSGSTARPLCSRRSLYRRRHRF